MASEPISSQASTRGVDAKGSRKGCESAEIQIAAEFRASSANGPIDPTTAELACLHLNGPVKRTRRESEVEALLFKEQEEAGWILAHGKLT